MKFQKARRGFFYILVLSVAFSWTSCKKHCHDTFRMPAEWEEHESIWVGWPTYDNKAAWPSDQAMSEMISHLAPHVLIDLCVEDATVEADAKAVLLAFGIPQTTIDSRIRFHYIPHIDWWFRDMGGVLLKNEHNELKQIDLNFNTWGYGPYSSTDPSLQVIEEGVDRAMAAELGIETESTSMIMEGGALEFNGQGTMIVSESVVFQRNPSWTKAQAEAEFKRLFRLKKVIWLEGYLGNDAHVVEGSPYDVNGVPTYTMMTTNGHTDEFVRFINSNTVLLCAPPSAQEALDNPIAAVSRTTLLAARQVLESETDQDGNPIQIIDLPEPPLIYETITDGDGSFDYITTLDFARVGKTPVLPGETIQAVLAASYMNYLVTNDIVLAPAYASLDPAAAATDAAAVAVLQSAFPGRQVISMDVRAINIGGGGIHCITQQMPATD